MQLCNHIPSQELGHGLLSCLLCRVKTIQFPNDLPLLLFNLDFIIFIQLENKANLIILSIVFSRLILASSLGLRTCIRQLRPNRWVESLRRVKWKLIIIIFGQNLRHECYHLAALFINLVLTVYDIFQFYNLLLFHVQLIFQHFNASLVVILGSLVLRIYFSLLPVFVGCIQKLWELFLYWKVIVQFFWVLFFFKKPLRVAFQSSKIWLVSFKNHVIVIRW